MVTVLWAAGYLNVFVGAIRTFIHVCGNTGMNFGLRCGGALASAAVIFVMGFVIMELCAHYL